MRGISGLSRILGMICITIYLLSSNSAAQGLSSSLANLGVASSNLVVGIGGQGNGNADVFFGKDNVGPYVLSWKPIDIFTEIVTVDGKPMQRTFDYEPDYTSGSIKFINPVASKSVIRVEYNFNTRSATRNKTVMLDMPMQLNLLRGGNGGLQFVGNYKSGSTPSGSDLAVLGLTGTTKGSNTGLNSMLLFTPDMSGNSGLGFDQLSALKLNGTATAGALQVNTLFSRVGGGFQSAKDYGLQAGLSTMQLAANFAASRALNFASSLNRTENISGDKTGQVNTVTTQQISYAQDGSPRVSLMRTENDKEKPGDDGSKTTTDKFQIDHNLGSSVTAAASHENVVSEVGDSKTESTVNQLVLSARAAENVAVQSKLVERKTTDGGSVTDVGVNINATPGRSVSLQAAMNRTESDATGKADVQTINLSTKPLDKVNLDVSVARKDSDAAGEELAHTVKLTTNPSSDVRLEIGIAGKDASQSGVEAQRSVSLATTTLKNTTLQVNWANKNSDASGQEDIGAIKVESNWSPSIKLTGAFTQKAIGESREINREARLVLRPFSRIMLAGAYWEREFNGAIAARIRELSASTNPLGFLGLTGAYKGRETVGAEDLDSLDVGVSLDTGRFLSLSGGYSSNPEDTNGIVQRFYSQKVGLNTNFGSVKIKGAYTSKDEYLSGIRHEVTEVGLDYQLSNTAFLSTSYANDQSIVNSELASAIYTLGFTQRIASSLNINIFGRMKTYEQNHVMLSDQTEYEAQANLGLKF